MEAMIKAYVDRAGCFIREQDGLAASEYAIVLGLLIIAAIGALQLLDVNLTSTLSSIADNVPGTSSGGHGGPSGGWSPRTIGLNPTSPRPNLIP